MLLFYQIGFPQQITHVEYWFGDNFANRLPPQPVTTNANNETDFLISFPDNGINEITETIYYRFLDSAGNWSCIYSQQMLNNSSQNNNFLEAEYWFDDNFAGKQTISLNQFLNIFGFIDHQEANISVANNIPQIIYYRFRGKYNQWSAIQSTDLDNTVYQNNSIDTLEYWFDDNFASKTIEQVVANANYEISWDIPWVANAQTVQYRFKTKFNQWSSIQSSNIDDVENRDNRIVGVEYWVDNNFITPNYHNINQTDTVYYDERDLSIINLDPCNPQTINVRYKDKMNRWSSIYSFYHGVAEPGITVLVHGFQLFGGISPTGDFENIGHEILQKAGGGIMYKNDANTGLLVPLEGTYQSDKEIVLIYDWGDLSNNGIYPLTSGNGYLEAAADNLFATIINLKTTVGLNNISTEEFLSKPKHFIGHSRGGVVLLQLAHRFENYFPNISIEQATFLDPHPATTFGDMNGDYTLTQPPNLPCVNGQATGCGSGITGCDTVGVGDYLKLPENIEKSDCYFREDNNFEGVLEGISLDWGQFDGLSFMSLGNFNRKLDNSVLNVGSPTFGGTHSGVHKWYLGTINTNDNFDVADGDLSLSSAHTNTTNWYSNLMTASMSNNFLQTETRCSTGFYYSRLGGGLNNLPTITTGKASIAEMNLQNAVRDLYFTDNNNTINLLGEAPHNVFNGNFNYNTDAGWTKNGGESVTINNKKANFYQYNNSTLKHSLMYFGNQYRSLKIDISEASELVGNPVIRVTFFNNQNTQVGITYELEFAETNKIIYVPLPLDIIGQVGTFQIEKGSTSSSFSLDNIQLLDNIPGHEVPRIVNLKLNIEGYYDTTTHEMRPVKANQGIGSSVTDVGDITVELVNPDTHETIATISTVLKTNGTATCNFPTVPHGTYYIVVKHRNAIQTWSATPVLVSAIPMTYDFSNDANKVYGANTVELENGVYGFYSGDINQDEIIDATDYSAWETDYNDFSFGNFSTDLNGDGIVDASDYSIWESNYNHFTFSSHP